MLQSKQGNDADSGQRKAAEPARHALESRAEVKDIGADELAHAAAPAKTMSHHLSSSAMQIVGCFSVTVAHATPIKLWASAWSVADTALLGLAPRHDVTLSLAVTGVHEHT
jgi:hypothetical protein